MNKKSDMIDWPRPSFDPDKLVIETLRAELARKDDEIVKLKYATLTRRRLPDERESITHEFEVGAQVGYIIIGLFENGQPGEIFILIDKEGSIYRIYDWVAIAISIGLQYGIPLEVYTKKFKYQNMDLGDSILNKSEWEFLNNLNYKGKLEMSTGNPDIPTVNSIIDYVAQWMEQKFVTVTP